MNRIIRSRLGIIAVILILPMALVGCNNCGVCSIVIPLLAWGNIVFALFWGMLLCPHCVSSADLTAISEFCEENPDECVATWEQMQTVAIEYCETNPEECQQAFDIWVEGIEEEASK